MTKYSSIEKMIDNVVDVVQKTYYSYVNPELWDDLRQEGYLAIWKVLGTGDFNPYRNLRTYMYTVARNAMSCFMYHEKKQMSNISLDELVQEGSTQDIDLVPVNENILNKISSNDSYFNKNMICDSKIKNVCYRFSDFGDYEERAKMNLANVGLYNKSYQNKEHIMSHVEEAIHAILIYEELVSLSNTY